MTPADDIEQQAVKIQTLVHAWRLFHYENLVEFGETHYGHYWDHAAAIYKLHARDGAALGAMGSGAHEHHIQEVKNDVRNSLSIFKSGFSKVEQLMRLQCARFEPSTREAARTHSKNIPIEKRYFSFFCIEVVFSLLLFHSSTSYTFYCYSYYYYPCCTSPTHIPLPPTDF